MGELKKKGFVFPSHRIGNKSLAPNQRIKNKPIHPNAFGQALRSKMEKFKSDDVEVEYFSAHDLRRTAATIMASLGYGAFVVGKILNHTDPSVTAVYDRYEYDKEKQAALEALERKMIATVTEQKQDNVVHLKYKMN